MKNKYALKSGILVDVAYPVEQEMNIGDNQVLLLMTKGSDTPDDNIICFSKDGVKQWIVEAYIPVTGDQNPYMSMKKRDDSDLLCRTWKGVDVIIDSRTGKIKNIVNTRPW